MRAEHTVTEPYRAALFQYLTGGACVSCNVSGTGKDQTVTWIFQCPKFDAEAIELDFNHPETTVLLADFLKALNQVSSFRNFARRSLDGMWRSERYANRT